MNALTTDLLGYVVSFANEKSLFELSKVNKRLYVLATETWANKFIKNAVDYLSYFVWHYNSKTHRQFGIELNLIEAAFKNRCYTGADPNNIKFNRSAIEVEIAKNFKRAVMRGAENDPKSSEFRVRKEINQAAYYEYVPSGSFDSISNRLSGIFREYLNAKNFREAEIIAHILPVESKEYFISDAFRSLAYEFFVAGNLKKAVKVLLKAPSEETKARSLAYYVEKLCDKNTPKDLEEARQLADMIPETQTDSKSEALKTIASKTSRESCVIS